MKHGVLLAFFSLLVGCAPGVTYSGPVPVAGTPEQAIIRLADAAPRLSPSGPLFGEAFSNFEIASIQPTALTVSAQGETTQVIVTCTAAATETGTAVTCTPEERSQTLYRVLQ